MPSVARSAACRAEAERIHKRRQSGHRPGKPVPQSCEGLGDRFFNAGQLFGFKSRNPANEGDHWGAGRRAVEFGIDRRGQLSQGRAAMFDALTD